MVLMLLTATLWMAGPAAGQPKADPQSGFVIEHALASEMKLRDGILRMSKSRGWLRTRQLSSDFIVTAHVLLETADTDASIGVRSLHADGEWPRRGHRVILSARAPAGEFRNEPVQPTKAASTAAGTFPVGDWRQVKITAIGPSVTVEIDGTEVGTHRLDFPSGAIAFSVTSGAAQFRDLQIKDIVAANPQPTMDELIKTPDFTAPKVLKEVRPDYTRSALQRKVDGIVLLVVEVGPDGAPGTMTIARFLDPELEHQAVAALRRWRFSPGQLAGKPIALRVEVEMSFKWRG